MRKVSLLIVTSILAITVTAKETIQSKFSASKARLSFIENKGQVVDQHGKQRNDIDYKLDAGGVTMFIGDGQLHYQWSRSANPKLENPNSSIAANTGQQVVGSSQPNSQSQKTNSQTEFYRMDVELLGADKHAAVIATDVQSYVEHYYLPQCRDGASAHSYTKVTYQNVYPNIDWVVYVSPHPASPQGGSDILSHAKDGASLKYDFVVHPGGDPAQIKLQYNGATSLQLKDGALIAETPFGTITEDVPYSYYADNDPAMAGEEVASSFELNGNVLSYNISNDKLQISSRHGGNKSLIIDPSLNWSTYYGGSHNESLGSIATDTAANVYLCAATSSSTNIATSGSFQSSYTSTLLSGCAVKFDSSGVRQWATYYGGADSTRFWSVATDTFGHVYFYGSTTDSGLATKGVFVATNPARYSSSSSYLGEAIFLTKFNASNGSRIWTIYIDSTGLDQGPMTCDMTGNIYIAGLDTVSGRATTGAFQTTVNRTDASCLLTKFDSSGTKLWATYYYMYPYALTTDNANNIYMAGASSATGVATPGAHKTITGGASAFIVKFSATGTRLWATYYGDFLHNVILGISCDVHNNVYMVGSTASSSGIATTGSFKPTHSGSAIIGFIAKFTEGGSRQWGTYYDAINTGVTCDKRSNVYIFGQAFPGVLTTTADAYQASPGGSNDAMLAVFNTGGGRRYCTYFGGPDQETTWRWYAFGIGGSNAVGRNISIIKDKLYFCGITNSTTKIATANAHQTSYGGVVSSNRGDFGDLFLTQFQMDTVVFIKEPLKDTLLCGLDTMHIPYGVNRPFRSSNTFTFQLSDASGNFASPVNIGTAGGSQRDSVFKWRVPANITAGTGYKVRILASAPRDTATENTTITLKPAPTATMGTNSPVCSGNTLLFVATTAYSGVTYSWTGPGGFNSTAQNPSINNTQTVHSGNYVVTTTLNGCTTKDSLINVVVNQSPATPTANSNSPICEGDDLNFTSTNTIPGVSYSWSGPGFTSPLQNPTIAGALIAATGTYTVTAKLGPCSATATTAVAVNMGPAIVVYPSPDDSLCVGKKLTMVSLATPATGGTAFQWQKGGVDVPGATGNNYSPPTVADGDIYSVKMTPAASYGCKSPIKSNSVTITVVQYVSPSVTMTADDTNAWPGRKVTFVATATDAGTFPKYQWKLNGKNVVGATGSLWGATNLSNNDSVCVEVTSTYMCPSPATATVCKKVKIATGIRDVTNGKLYIWPNPTGAALNIEGLSIGTKIQLADVYGRIVYSGVATSATFIVNTSNLVPGNYILQVTDADGARSSYKVVKQ